MDQFDNNRLQEPDYSIIEVDTERCNRCGICVDMCPMDIFAPNPEKGKSPIVMYPDECEFDGSCWAHCPTRDKGAIDILMPLSMRASILKGAREVKK